MRTTYRCLITVVLASLTLCSHGSDEKICNKPDSFICGTPGASLGCALFSFMRLDCPRLCKECIDATTTQATTNATTMTASNVSGTAITTMETLAENSNPNNSDSNSSPAITSVVLTESATTTVLPKEEETINSTETNETRTNMTTTQSTNGTVTTAAADHVYPSLILLIVIFLNLLLS